MLICRWVSSETRWELSPDQIRSIEGVDGERGIRAVRIGALSDRTRDDAVRVDPEPAGQGGR